MQPEQNHRYHRYRRAAADYLGRPMDDPRVIRLAHRAAKIADQAAIAWPRQVTAQKSAHDLIFKCSPSPETALESTDDLPFMGVSGRQPRSPRSGLFLVSPIGTIEGP